MDSPFFRISLALRRPGCRTYESYKLMRAFFFVAILLVALAACKRQVETYTAEDLTEYMPLRVGYTTLYQLDSTVFVNAGRTKQVHSYLEKNVVDAELTDNQGRLSYRVIRYIKDLSGADVWRMAGTYMITPSKNSIEVVENNLRVVRLVQPVRQGYAWHGFQHLPDDPYNPTYPFANDNNINSWECVYADTKDTFSYNQQTVTGVLKVVHVDEKFTLDTVDVINNTALIPETSGSVWLRGDATDTIILTAGIPEPGNERLVIYNQANQYASLNNIKIPPNRGFIYEFANGQWYYSNALRVIDNRVNVPGNFSSVTLFGPATDSIKVNALQLDTFQVKKFTVYNKSNFDAYSVLRSPVDTFKIPPGFGRSYELHNKQWRLFENRNFLLETDPYLTDLPYGSFSYSTDKYAKGIGLVYQELLLWEYEPNPSGASPYTIGFGVTRRLVEHN